MANRAFLYFLTLLLVGGLSGASAQQFTISTSASVKGQTKVLSSATKTDATPSSVAAPNISYETPQNYVINKAISPLAPANSGGAVPAAIYGQTTIVSGSYTEPYYYTVTGVAIDANGKLYVADWGDNKIKVVDANGGVPSVFAGNFQSGAVNGQGTAATFYEPDALLFDNAGNLMVSDQGNHLIRKITPSGLVSTYAGSGAMNANNGAANVAGFNNPRGLTMDKAGNLYVADQGNNLIRKITPAGIVSTYAGNGTQGLTNGPALSASFNTLTAVEIDDNGNLYVADSDNGCVRKISTAGIVSTLATGLNFPRELRIDGTGNLYVLEQQGYRLTRISPTGVKTLVTTVLQNPIGLAMDGKGSLYVGDASLVRKVSISGYIIDKALPPGLSFNQTTGVINGTPASAWPSTDYVITAFNGGGSSTTVVNITVGFTVVKKPSIITLPTQQPGQLNADNTYDPKGTSTNKETPIIYTSSDPAIAEVLPNGLIKVKAPGQTIITAYQAGNENYNDAIPVQQTLTVVEHLAVFLPDMPPKTVCDADFSANGVTSQPKVPVTYTSSNTAVATITNTGVIHIVGAGTTTITMAQNANPPLYVSAIPVSKTLNVTIPLTGSIQITSNTINPCQNTPVTFTAVTKNAGANVKYQWQVNGSDVASNQTTFTSSTLTSTDKVTCIYTNLDNTCVAQYPVTSNAVITQITKGSNPTVTIAASVDFVFPGTSIAFTATVKDADNPVTYNWLVNDLPVGLNSAVFTSTTLQNNDKVTVVITDANACSVPVISNLLTVNIVDRIIIPNTFTPNGDGINDTWNITGLVSYAECRVNIYDRYGWLVYQSAGYGSPWDGTKNGSALPASTYYYVINLGATNVPEPRMSGSITILR